MNSYFNAGYHDWQSSELHHYASNRFCTSPSLASGSSSQANLYGPNSSYHSYMHSNGSPHLSYTGNMGYGALPPSPSSHRYAPLGESVGSARTVFGSHAAGSLSFPSSNLSSHLYGDHIVFGNLSSHYPVSGGELTYSEITSQPSSDHLLTSEPLRDSSPEHLPTGDKSASENECPVSESSHIVYSSACAKLPTTYDCSGLTIGTSSGSVALGKDNTSQQSQHTFEDSSPSSTPDNHASNGPSSALPSNKAFFPWMKSYTGKLTYLSSTLAHCAAYRSLLHGKCCRLINK